MQKPSRDSVPRARALFLSPEAPYPAVGGGPLRSASVFEFLAQHFDVDAIVFRTETQPDPTPAGAARTLVLRLPTHRKDAFSRALRNSVRLLRRTPPLVDRFSGFECEIAAFVDQQRYDVAILEHFWSAPYCRQIAGHTRQILLNLHNIESTWHARLAKLESGMTSIALRRFAEASGRLERELLPRFSGILVTSPEDARTVREIVPAARTILCPNSIPELPAPKRVEEETIIFTGNMEYRPNQSAVAFFARQVWPLLRARWPALQWRIAGRNPEAIRKLAGDDACIAVTGPMENAVLELAKAKVAVVPVLTGSGTRVKILEAWAAATPVVSTPLGAEGLPVIDGQHLLLAGDATAFADAVSALLSSETLRLKIGAAGRRLYEEQFTWNAAWRVLERELCLTPYTGN